MGKSCGENLVRRVYDDAMYGDFADAVASCDIHL